MKNFINKIKMAFKEPILKNELKRFLLEGLLLVFVFATLLGVLEFLFLFTKFSFLSMFTFVIYYAFLSRRLKENFSYYHILYSILAVVFLIVGDYIMGVSGAAIQLIYLKVPLQATILNPIYHFQFLFYWPNDFLVISLNMLNIVIYTAIIYFMWQNMKR